MATKPRDSGDTSLGFAEFAKTLPKTRKEIAAELALALETAEKAGYVVHKPRPADPGSTVVDLPALAGKERIKMAVVSCTHFGSKYQQLTALREFCAYAASQKVDMFIHGGDVEDGPTWRHKNPEEVFLHTHDAVKDYVVANLPRHKGIPWYILGGNHDAWRLIDGGPDLLKQVCAERDDCTYLGSMLGYLHFGDTLVEVYHMDAGSAYAYSYKLQTHINTLSADRKPNLVLMGNFHKFCALHFRGVMGIQLPAFQRQTKWMATKSLVSEVAGVIVEIGLHPKGLAPVIKMELVETYEPREEDWP